MVNWSEVTRLCDIVALPAATAGRVPTIRGRTVKCSSAQVQSVCLRLAFVAALRSRQTAKVPSNTHSTGAACCIVLAPSPLPTCYVWLQPVTLMLRPPAMSTLDVFMEITVIDPLSGDLPEAWKEVIRMSGVVPHSYRHV